MPKQDSDLKDYFTIEERNKSKNSAIGIALVFLY